AADATEGLGRPDRAAPVGCLRALELRAGGTAVRRLRWWLTPRSPVRPRATRRSFGARWSDRKARCDRPGASRRAGRARRFPAAAIRSAPPPPGCVADARVRR